MAKAAKPSAALFEFKPRDPAADAPELPLATLDRKPELAPPCSRRSRRSI